MKYAIILCGGLGTRLWPLSTHDNPKQFHKLVNLSDNTNVLIENTINRLPNDINKVFISNIAHKKHMEKYNKYGDIIYESYQRNTSPAILMSCLHILHKHNDIDPNNINICILPCDHIIDGDKFKIILDNIFNDTNNKNNIVTLGITPTEPNISYGYIKKNNYNNKIEKFIEKPNKNIAEILIQDNTIFWNSGIFMSNIKTIINEYISIDNEMYIHCLNCYKLSIYSNNVLELHDSYSLCKNISFDYDIMEKTSIGCIMKFEGLWSDIGEWKRAYNISDKDNNNNVIIGNNNVVYNSKNLYINVDNNKTEKIVVNNIDNIVIVKKNGVIFISSMDNSNNYNNLDKI
jgi:mannose-1-phosphate guanylyltransferase